MAPNGRLSLRLIEAIAQLEECEPANVSPPLNDVLDSQAVDSLPEWGDDDVYVTVEYGNHEVTIGGTGVIHVDGVRFPPGDDLA
jgi:hypothetical protein